MRVCQFRHVRTGKRFIHYCAATRRRCQQGTPRAHTPSLPASNATLPVRKRDE